MSWIVGPSTDVVVSAMAEARPQGVSFLDTWSITDWCAQIDPPGEFHARTDSGTVTLHPDERYFARILDIGRKLSGEEACRHRSMTSALNVWLSRIPLLVMNPPVRTIHNGSKPLHEHMLSSMGLDVPSAITSSDRRALCEFAASNRAIVKTLSGVRARARCVSPDDFGDDANFSGPVHLQTFVEGDDVRAHVVLDRIHAVRIAGRHVDYRHSDGERSPIRDGTAVDVPDDIAHKIISGTREMDMLIAGWDFKVDDDGKWWCLEANPMPAFTPYDVPLGNAIRDSVISWLSQVQ